MVVHHTLATYDGFLLGGAIFEATGRLPRGLGDDRIFQIPWLRGVATRVGLTPASPSAGEALLRAGELLGVAPGGMWESLRPREERRQSRWEGRRGFIRLAIRCNAPILLAACPRADDLFTVYANPVTDRVYRRLHLPLPLARGVGPTLLPRPLALIHHLAPLLRPPIHDPDREEDQVDALYAEARDRMAELLRRA
jgi:1-acyl-sn-glycerol-3-phosphate acyltransferase